MRWGSGEAQFVRPVHGLVMLHGDEGRAGQGARTRSRATRRAAIASWARARSRSRSADEYEETLLDEGKVIADFAQARSRDRRANCKPKAKQQKGSLGEYRDLLDEVTALVEHPTVYVGEFDKAFLDVPQECLILTMRQNQKYFPLFDAGGKLLPKFLIVSNMQVADPRHIVGGNERVVRPRLEDARFFFDQDRKQRLEERVPQLAKVVYHNKLGSQLERVQRIKLLAGKIARELGADALQAERAARARQGRPAHRHGRRVPGAAGHHGALLRAARRRARRGRRRDRGALPPALRRRPAARGPDRLRGRARRQARRARRPVQHRPAADRRQGSRSACAAPRWAWCASWSSASFLCR